MKRLALPLLSLLLLGLPRPAAAAVADTTAYGDLRLDFDLLLHPGQPCAADEVLLYVQGFEATGCDSFLGVTRVPGQPITIRTLHRAQIPCPLVLTRPYAVQVPLGLLMAGTHSIVVRRERLVLSPDGTLDSTVTDTTYEFPVSAACPVIAPVPVTDLPLVEAAATRPPRPCPDQPVALELAGHFTDGCGRVESMTAIAPDRVSLVLAPYPPVRQPCTEILPLWSASAPLGSLPAGNHSVVVDLTVRGALWKWPPIPDTHHRGLFDFTAATPCDSLVTLLPYVENIQIGPPDRPICPTDSFILVKISGSFPGACCASKRIVVLPNPVMTPLPEPPIVRVIVDHDTPLACPCIPALEPWTGTVVLPPLPIRDYTLPVEVLERGGGSDSTLTATRVPFKVDSCGTSDVCMWVGWEHQGPFRSCDAYVSPESEGTVTLMVRSGVALSGLQGTLRSWEPGLYVSSIEPVGVAAGMRLSWARESQGARFVLFADNGAPIPAGEAQEILKVHALALQAAGIPEDPPPPPPGPVFHLGAGELLGADVKGNGVHECLPPPYVRLAPDVAVLCIEQLCDFNQDGLNDVRDIVQMVRCANDDGPCPPDVGTRFDCNGDGQFGLGDVLCCAFHMLRQPGCPTCPIDTVRVEPTVTVAFGEPRRLSGAVDVPLKLGGLNRVGAARLRLRFPSDRFNAQLMGYTEIFYLQEVENDMLTLGMIGGVPVPVPVTGGDPPPPFDYPGPGLVVRLTLRPGQSFGGELQLADGQLSGPDGVLLDVDLDVPGVPLEGNGVALSAPWPNPSWGPVEFTITLDAPARLEVAVHDIAGRRLATVFRGNRDAGLQPFSWNGRRDDGTEATTGVYFLRVVANDQVWKRKVVVVRGPQIMTVQPVR